MVNPLEGLITRDDIAGIAATEGLILDDEERISVLEAMHSIDVQACPGSGKTTLIATKLILLAKKWPLEHQGICVLSHTNVAKDEIIDRLKRSKTIEAQCLLSYPHFIGTIQEFVNRYVSLPFLRSKGVSNITVDNDEYVKVARKLLGGVQFGWLRGTLNGLGGADAQEGFLRTTFRFGTPNGLEVNISRRPRAWQQQQNFQRAQRALNQLKQYLDEQGFYLFKDMYSHAEVACFSNKELPIAISKRFPCVFIDEMQDTQKFQDELLCNIFPLGDPERIIQRFGDPDQAIFHGIGSEEENESFNGKSAEEMDVVVHKSHRFDDGLASRVKPFSFNEIPLETELSDDALVTRSVSHVVGSNFEHTIIIFDDDTCASVVQCFGEIVSNQFSDESKGSGRFLVKVVGAVGNKSDPNADQLKIDHYWSEYDKSKSKSSFKEGSLIEAVRYCRQSLSADWADSYKLLINCVLRLLRMSNARDDEGKYFSASSVREWLKAKGKWECFRKNIHLMLNGAHEIDQGFWDDTCEALKTIFEFENSPAEATEYMAFAEEDAPIDTDEGDEGQGDNSIVPLPKNMIVHPDGFQIELSTIHGVKGETHDATLVVETKNHCFDLETMLPYLVEVLPNDDHPNQQLPDKPNSRRAFKPNKVFMRQFYVAMSRPKHLLCLAIHSDRISDAQKEALIVSGWLVQELT